VIVSSKTSIWSESGGNKHRSFRCSSSNSFSLAWSRAHKKSNTFEISYWKYMSFVSHISDFLFKKCPFVLLTSRNNVNNSYLTDNFCI
jgi:hypothetical protein